MEKMAIGVFSSLSPDPKESLNKVKELGIPTIQTIAPPADLRTPEGVQKIKDALEATGITITTVFCGFAGERYDDIPTVRKTVGLVPAETRIGRVAQTKQIIDFANALGVKRVAAHIGFIPEDSKEPLYVAILEVIRAIVDYCASKGIVFALETGQETAPALFRFIKDVNRPNLKVNFDPANMILYGSGNPLEALDLLKEYVDGVHCKDGKWPTEPEKLGHEYPLGQGDVNIPEFVRKLHSFGYTGPLTIEREITGEQQRKDIKAAKEFLEKLRAELK